MKEIGHDQSSVELSADTCDSQAMYTAAADITQQHHNRTSALAGMGWICLHSMSGTWNGQGFKDLTILYVRVCIEGPTPFSLLL